MSRPLPVWHWVGAIISFLLLLVSAATASSGAGSGLLRYRGEYTYGHEVRSFCPAINSQCYWVDAASSKAVRAALGELAAIPGAEPYRAVCVVIEGRIDRESKRDGFAADYDGLILITRVFGRCNETDIVTQGDLQHHRWILHSVDDKPVGSGAMNDLLPELDFGQLMTVTGNTGCNRFSGRAILRDDFFRIAPLASTHRLCAPPRNELEVTLLQVLGNESRIIIGDDRQLVLDAGHTKLRFRLSDWKK